MTEKAKGPIAGYITAAMLAAGGAGGGWYASERDVAGINSHAKLVKYLKRDNRSLKKKVAKAEAALKECSSRPETIILEKGKEAGSRILGRILGGDR